MDKGSRGQLRVQKNDQAIVITLKKSFLKHKR